MDYSSGRGHGCRLLAYTHRGLGFVAMENERLRLDICADRGSDILNLVYKPRDIDFMWKSPTGLKEPGKFIATCASAGGNYADYLAGGWQELLPSGGPDVIYGAELGLHGEVALLPWQWQVETDTEAEVSVRFQCDTVRLPFRVEKTVTLRRHESIIRIAERLTNLSPQRLEFIWAQHPTFGSPLIAPGTRLDIPAKTFSTSDFYQSPTAILPPRFEGAWPSANGHRFDTVGDQPTTDLYYFKDLTDSWYAVTNPDLKIGFGMRWNLDEFPYLTMWQALHSAPGSHWFDRINCLSLELWNSYTDRLRTARQNGTLRTIGACETISVAFAAVIYEGLDQVREITPGLDVH